jgi:hypothetical protein
METKFEEIIESYQNGQRKQCANQFDALTDNEKHNFKGWVKDFQHATDTELLEIILFLLIR